jgi:hypothetical protein
MVRTRRVAFAQSGYRFPAGTSAPHLPGDHPQRDQIPIRFIPSDHDLLRAPATRNFSIYRLLVPATELPNADLIVVLLDTCGVKAEREEQNADPVGHPVVLADFYGEAPRPIGPLAA